eukprot:6690690-Pyramimonas_sp.AAC.1
MAARCEWDPACADIMSTFIQGEERPRDKPLVMEQPPHGLPGLQDRCYELSRDVRFGHRSKAMVGYA